MNGREIKGITTELLCQTEFVKRGFNVSVPISSYCKYDFIVDIEDVLYRVQVKYANKEKTGIRISTTSSHLSTNGSVIKKYSKKDIDYICTVYEDNCYLIPIYEIEKRTSVTLSFDNKWKNGHHIMIADDYLIDNQIELLRKGFLQNNKKNYVIQKFSKDGKFICEYNTVAECDVCKEDIRKQSHISDCVNGKRKTAYGYVWKRVEKQITLE